MIKTVKDIDTLKCDDLIMLKCPDTKKYITFMLVRVRGQGYYFGSRCVGKSCYYIYESKPLIKQYYNTLAWWKILIKRGSYKVEYVYNL